MITIFIRDQKGQDRFPVYQDLVILHSEYLHGRIQAAPGEGKIEIDNMINIRRDLFAQFIPWITSGSFPPFDSRTQGAAVNWVLLWQMGSDLQVRATLL
jgi:hypothetical protein